MLDAERGARCLGDNEFGIPHLLCIKLVRARF